MRRLACIIMFAGMLSLALLFQLPPKPLFDQAQLEHLLPNQKIMVQGSVIAERGSSSSKTLLLNNNVSLSCTDCLYISLLQRNVTVLATLEEFNGRRTLKVLRISYR